MTVGEGVAAEVLHATASGAMIDHLANGVQAASAQARVGALLIVAGQVRWTLGVDGALRTTARWHSDVVCQASAGKTVAAYLTLGIGSALGRLTWIRRVWYDFC